MYTPYRPRHRRPRTAGGPEGLPVPRRPDPSRGLTGSPTGPDTLLLIILTVTTALVAALVLGGLAASPFSPGG